MDEGGTGLVDKIERLKCSMSKEREREGGGRERGSGSSAYLVVLPMFLRSFPTSINPVWKPPLQICSKACFLSDSRSCQLDKMNFQRKQRLYCSVAFELSPGCQRGASGKEECKLACQDQGAW